MSLKYTLRSSNRKVGPIPVTSRSGSTCPASCPLVNPDTLEPGAGCYGNGRIAYYAKRDGSDERTTLDRLAAEAPTGTTVRHHEVGDLMTNGRVDRRYLGMLRTFARRRPDLSHILYTHAWRDIEPSALPFTVNASCETVADVRDATRRGFMATMIVESPDDPTLSETVDGRRIILCPQQRDDTVTCAQCRLCAKSDRDGFVRPVVAFAAHGSGKRTTVEMIRRRRAPAITGTTSGLGIDASGG